ncbi:glycosyltransferase [Marinobacter sp. SS13-12]|uniref:glycosyltransferase n=1 Tax=Marinobacter sp. SS13-12 TaxID=3050451 RepID=UPI002555C7AC|nr:glycosyltransferase [Marinobacter sp. SS13-12]MDK8464279.1 glycosyltransferase [Marinobacter sp. SS13-12]
MRITFVSLIPDAGHVIPLLRIASALTTDDIECRFIVPEEGKSLPATQGFEYELLPPVLPANASSLLKRISHTSPLYRKLYFNRYFESHYFQPIQYKGLSFLPLLKDKFQQHKPDLIIADEHLLGAAIHDLGVQLGIPVLMHRASGSNQQCQNPQPYAKRPSLLASKSIPVLSKIIGKLSHAANSKLNKEAHRSTQEMKIDINRKWDEIIKRGKLSGKPKQIFTTGMATVESRHLQPKITVCGGIQAFGPLPPLVAGNISNEDQAWLEMQPKKPVILVSLGSMVTITNKLSHCLIRGAKENHCRILWVSRTDPVPTSFKSDPDIRWISWGPQPTLLADQRIRGFVSHAGSGAVQEAFWFAKPLLCIPQIWDQPYNAWVVETLGAGRVINKNHFSVEQVSRFLSDILHDNAIKETMDRYSREIRELDSGTEVSEYILAACNSETISVNRPY